MRATTLLAALSLALALASLAPAAAAGPDVCDHVDCSAVPCLPLTHCIIVDPCQFRSDCCSTVNVWCPETE